MTSLRQKAVNGICAGDWIEITRTFTEADVAQFSEITQDYNPVHFDGRFSKAKNFSGKICHGLLIGSMITEIGGQIGWLATEMRFKFKKPVYPGDTITCRMTITHVDEKGFARAEAVLQNTEGQVVLEAVLKGFLPKEPEKEVMRQMIKEGDQTNPIRDIR